MEYSSQTHTASEHTALLDVVSNADGFSFMQVTRSSVSTSSIPYFSVSVKMPHIQKNKQDKFHYFVLKPLSCLSKQFTFIFATVGEHQTAILTLLLEVVEPLAHLKEAEVFFEQCVTM